MRSISLSLCAIGALAAATACSVQAAEPPAMPTTPIEQPTTAPAPQMASAPMTVGSATLTDKEIRHEHIYFETNKADLKSDSFRALDDIVALIKQHPEIKRIHVIGHTDVRGKTEENRVLSDLRAGAVEQYLKGHGVTTPIDHRGAGESQPLCNENSDTCHAKNRRVEISIEK